MFAQEVIESIFGLRRDEISGIGRFSPCFPRDWDRAELQLPKAGLAYQQKNGVHTFRLRMENGARKEFLWRLPPYGKITAKVDHQPAEVFTRKGCGWFEAKIQLGEKTEYLVEISYTPISFTLRYPKVAACGDKFSLQVEGGWLEGLDDRCGLFSQVVFGEQNQLQGVLREDLLEPYEKFGWFGRINCARRTLFLKLQAEGITFTWPVTVTLLPRLAASALLTEQGLCVTLSNCSATPISDNGSLLFGKECSVLPLRLEGKQEHRFCFPFSEQQRQAVTWGQNTAALRLGSLQVAIPFEGQPLASEGPRPVSLDKAGLVPAEHWEAIGKLPPNRSHMFTADFHLFMKGLLEKNQTITPFPGLTMELNPKGFVPIDGADQRPVTISLSGLRGKKIYLLLSTFLTNHNIFSEVFRIQLETEQKEAYMRPIFNRTLCFPGQLDMGFSGRCIFGFPTFVEEEKRGELPQLPLEADCEDYPHVQPPEYPQHSLWSETKALQRNDTVFNLVELELGETRDLKELRIFPLQPDGAAGLFALSIE